MYDEFVCRQKHVSKTLFLALHDTIQDRCAKAGRYKSKNDMQVDWLQIPRVIDDER
jgi:hypothetical protein